MRASAVNGLQADVPDLVFAYMSRLRNDSSARSTRQIYQLSFDEYMTMLAPRSIAPL